MATLNDVCANSGDFDDALTNMLRPLTDCFLTVRIIKSFTFRTTKNLLLPHVDATKMTVGQLKDLCREREWRGTGSRESLPWSLLIQHDPPLSHRGQDGARLQALPDMRARCVTLASYPS